MALPFPDPPLTDGDVTLRAWRRSEERQRFEAFSDPVVQRFSWPSAEPFTWEQMDGRFDAQEADRLAGISLNLAIVDAERPDVLLGAGSLYDVDPAEERASVGYWVVADARGRGVATRALRLMSAWAFEELSLARLELTCGPDNLASQRVAEKAGFTREGVLRSHMRFKDGRRDTVVYSLLPTD
ncbi:GNAT family protein [Actinocrispum sp. NPDC049592]|uniref:GNAT family N-acetyltransferase n=1 Tax=Actinocrispum sp. NPDC049592 TaxID=3154835 RepID=UPI003445BE18